METIIAASITGFITLAVCMVNNHYQNNSTRNLIEYRLRKLEELTALQEEKIKVANHRIDDLEKVGG